MSHTYTTTIEVEPEDADAHEAVVVVTLGEWHPFVAATRYEPSEGGWEGVSVTLAGEPMSERHPNYDWLVFCDRQGAHREECENDAR